MHNIEIDQPKGMSLSESSSSSSSSSSSNESSNDNQCDNNTKVMADIKISFKWTKDSIGTLSNADMKRIESEFTNSKGMCVMDEERVFFLEPITITGQSDNAILPGVYMVHRCQCTKEIVIDHMCNELVENDTNLPIASYFGSASMLTLKEAVECTLARLDPEFDTHSVRPQDRLRALFDDAGTPCNSMCPVIMTKQQCIFFGRCVFNSSVPAAVKNSKPYRLLRCLPDEGEFELNGYDKKGVYDRWRSVPVTDWHEHLDRESYTGITTARGSLKHATLLHQCTIMHATSNKLQPSIPLMFASQSITARDTKENKSIPHAGNVVGVSYFIPNNNQGCADLTMLPLWLAGKNSWIESNTKWIDQAKQAMMFVDHDTWLQTDGADNDTIQSIPLSNAWCLSAFSPWSVYHNILGLDTDPMQEKQGVIVRNGSFVPTNVFEAHLKFLYDKGLSQHQMHSLHMDCLLSGLVGMEKKTMQALLTHWKKSKMTLMETGGEIYNYLVSNGNRFFGKVDSFDGQDKETIVTHALVEIISNHFRMQNQPLPMAVPCSLPSPMGFVDELFSDPDAKWLTRDNCSLHPQLFEAIKDTCVCNTTILPKKLKGTSMSLAKLEHTYKSVRSGILTALSPTDVNGQRVMLSGIPAIQCGVCGCDYTEGCSHETEMHRISRILEWEQVAAPLIKAQDIKSLRLTQAEFLSTHNLSMGVQDYHVLVGTPEEQLEANIAVIEAAMEWRKDKKAEPRWRIECISEDNTIISGRASPGWEIFTRCISEDHWNKEKNRPTRIPIKSSDRERLTRGKRTRNV